MGEFNYEVKFMGVIEDAQGNYLRTFKDDYRLKRLKELLRIRKGRILDIGCGGGITTESLNYYYPNTRVYGCDVSREAIKYAKMFGSKNVEYKVIKKNKLPYKDNF